jgi:hypothetical protein
MEAELCLWYLVWGIPLTLSAKTLRKSLPQRHNDAKKISAAKVAKYREEYLHREGGKAQRKLKSQKKLLATNRHEYSQIKRTKTQPEIHPKWHRAL